MNPHTFTSFTKSLTGALVIGALAQTATAKIMDFGVDSENLGLGDQIYYMSMATNKLGGNVSSVTNVPSLMSYYQSKGVKWLAIKAGTGSTHFPSDASKQVTSAVITEAHNKGIKVFPYNRSNGTNVTGEITLANYYNGLGADGFIIDAEVEWESQNLSGGPAKATQLCAGIKSAYPTRFLAHCPLPIISLHSSFPYKEFGKGCDTVMPQAYWNDLGKTPAAMVTWMNTEWRNWQDSLGAADRDAVKPLAPVGQAYVVNPQTYTNGHIAQFFQALKTNMTCVTPGGYRGISFWRADMHTAQMWTEIGTNSIGGSAPTDGSFIIDNTGATVVGTWSTGTASTDKYGADYRYKGKGTGTAYLQYTPVIPSAGNYNVYEWHTQGANRDLVTPHAVTHTGGTTTVNVNGQSGGGVWNSLGMFNFAAGSSGYVRVTDAISTAGQIAGTDAIRYVPVVSDIIIDNTAAVVTGSWSVGTSSTDKYGANYHWKAGGSGSASVQFIPNIPLTGNYAVYEWHTQGANRPTNAPYTIAGGGTNTPVVVTVSQVSGGGAWTSLGTHKFAVGTSGSITLKDNFTGSAGNADAVKLVFVSQ